MAQVQECSEVDNLAIEQSGDEPRHHRFFCAPNADDFEKLSLRLYLSGSLTAISKGELDIRKSSHDRGFVDPHEFPRFDHKGVAVITLREDRRFSKTRPFGCAMDYEALSIRSNPFKIHAPVENDAQSLCLGSLLKECFPSVGGKTLLRGVWKTGVRIGHHMIEIIF